MVPYDVQEHERGDTVRIGDLMLTYDIIGASVIFYTDGDKSKRQLIWPYGPREFKRDGVGIELVELRGPKAVIRYTVPKGTEIKCESAKRLIKGR